MTSGKILRQLIKAGVQGDQDSFREISESIIEHERQKQHHLLAKDLEEILYGENFGRPKGNIRHFIPKSPTDNERGLPLLDIKQPTRSVEDIILSEENISELEDLTEEHRRKDVLHSYGMHPSNKVLFYGPPGCGKTLAAEVIAFSLDIPLAIIRLDALVSSYLGETATNLRKIFEFISEYSVLALFDEFDAIGKTRIDSGEHGELRRVVNTVLQMMDQYQGSSLIIAATNHEQILDKAIWRRFDEAIQFSLPDNKQIKQILELKLRGIRREFSPSDPDIINLFKGYSGADIERVIRRAIKRMILRNQEFLNITDLKRAKSREKRYLEIKEE